ncbi:hypothetical protein AHiyo4_46280 [Arthrobacter sp. Hiyo4]|nr:hypothetical protein AHiyo4_46280 [Arthrobacter sp. Hiyo4]
MNQLHRPEVPRPSTDGPWHSLVTSEAGPRPPSPYLTSVSSVEYGTVPQRLSERAEASTALRTVELHGPAIRVPASHRALQAESNSSGAFR